MALSGYLRFMREIGPDSLAEGDCSGGTLGRVPEHVALLIWPLLSRVRHRSFPVVVAVSGGGGGFPDALAVAPAG